MNQFTNIESQRILQVLSETRQKLDILCHLPNDLSLILNNEDLSPDVVFALKNQLRHEQDLKQINTELPELTSVTQTLCKILLKDPKNLYSKSSKGISSFSKTLTKVCEIVQNRLATSFEHEAEKTERLRELSISLLKSSKEHDFLLAEVNSVKSNWNTEMQSMIASEQKTRADICEIRNSAEQTANIISSDATQVDFSYLSAYEETSGKMTEKLATLESEFESNTETSRDAETIARLRCQKAAKDLAEKKKKNEMKMAEMNQERKELVANLDEETSKFNVLDKYFQKIDEDLQRQAEEAAIIEAERLKHLAAAALIANAASKIQALFRGRSCRNNLKKKKKKKGKKKK